LFRVSCTLNKKKTEILLQDHRLVGATSGRADKSEAPVLFRMFEIVIELYFYFKGIFIDLNYIFLFLNYFNIKNKF